MLLFFMLLAGSEVYAVCSQYNGLTTINEAGKVGFVELKLLWSSIPASTYQNWRVKICTPQGNQDTCTGYIYFNASPLENGVYLRVYSASIPNNKPFDVILEDGNGDTIDYLSVGGYLYQQDPNCTPYYDWTAPLLNSSHDYHRMPDGTGEWGDAGPGATGGDSGGTTNDENSPIITVSDITLPKGQTAIFTMTIPAPEAYDVSVQFITVDGSATAGTHYTYTPGTALISAGSTSTTMSIPTQASSPGGTVVFYLSLQNAVNGTPSNHFPAATLIDSPGVDHIEITHDGNGLTCSPEVLTVKACADAACSSVVNTDIDVTLAASGATSSWSQNPITIPANSSTGVTLELIHRTPETVVLSAITSPTATNPTICLPACSLPFSEAGFLVNLANHQSCSTSNLTIQAVEMSNTGNSCAPAYSGNQSVNLIYDYLNPATGSTIPDLAGTAMAANESVAQNRMLNFDATATATLPLVYNDAGQISITVNDAANAGLSSGSVTAVVTPAQLVVSATAVASACVSGDAACSIFRAAGDVFELNIKAACSDPSIITPNFVTTNGVDLAINTVAPVIAPPNPVALGVTSINFSNSDNGSHSELNQSVSEVGVFTITATANNYFGSALPTGTSANIGRFTPANFLMSVPVVPLQCGSFTYAGYFDGVNSGLDRNGQVFDISGSLTARNLANATTRNYVGAFAKLTSGNIMMQPYNLTAAANAAGRVNFSPAALNFVNGVSNYSDANSDYQYASLAAPFDLRVDLTATDSDAVSSGLVSSNGFEVRLGRMLLMDSFGPEIDDLEIRLSAEYFNGTDWVFNSADSCSSYVQTDASLDAASYTENLNAGETVVFSPPAAQTLNNGISTIANGIWFTAPGDDNYGSVLVNLNLATQGWLQYDWDADNNLDATSSLMSFGYYRGSDRMIYWREIRN